MVESPPDMHCTAIMTRSLLSKKQVNDLPNFHTDSASVDLPFPIAPPRARAPTIEHWRFWAYLLLPGFSVAFHAASLGRCVATIASYRLKANEAADRHPEIAKLTMQLLFAIRPEHGLMMAQRRGLSHLPYWSRLAVFEYRKRGATRAELAAIFRCSRGTIANILGGNCAVYDHSSGARILTGVQLSPPGKRLQPAEQKITPEFVAIGSF